MAKQKKKSKKFNLPILVVVILMLAFGASCLFYNTLNPLVYSMLFNNFGIVSLENSLLVHYISIGQGDAIAINLPDGRTLFIDTGIKSSASTYQNYIDERVLNTSRDNYIDYLVLTHADADHIGCAQTLLENYDVGQVFMPVVAGTSTTYTNLVSYISENQISVVENYDNSIIESDNYSVTFYGPVDDTETNAACPVIKITYLGRSFLFTGDISSDVEAEFVTQYGDELSADVLKVAHHGSAGSSSTTFLETVNPEYAVICVGAGNSYGHPTDDALSRIDTVGATIYRTDIDGNILFAVGAYYDLGVLTGDYTTTSLSLDYRYLVLIIEVVLGVYIVVMILRPNKKAKK